MRQDVPRDMAASVKSRLLQVARAERSDFNNLLTRYAIERFLYRLSRSDYRDRLVLKGANLFALWLGSVHRPTRDLDFLGYGSDAVEPLVEMFQALCRQAVGDDGLVFEAETVKGAPIREGAKYAGVRITLRALLGRATVPLQIDIGFGDVVTPAAQEAEMPTLLDAPKARLLVYPRETVIAEKCEALVDLGLANTRLKDFYDLWHLATHFDFDGALLCQAIMATFQRRGTSIVSLPLSALTPAFYNDRSKEAQWKAFWTKSSLSPTDAITLPECAGLLHTFLLPLLQAVQQHLTLDLDWHCQSRSWEAAQDVKGESVHK